MLGGLCFALNNVMLRREAAQPEEGGALAMFAGGALVAGLVAALCSARIGVFGLAGIGWPAGDAAQWWLPTLALALAFLAANLALQYGAARLPANVTAVVMPAEVPIATLSAMWLGGEAVQPAVWAGGALILGATRHQHSFGGDVPANGRHRVTGTSAQKYKDIYNTLM